MRIRPVIRRTFDHTKVVNPTDTVAVALDKRADTPGTCLRVIDKDHKAKGRERTYQATTMVGLNLVWLAISAPGPRSVTFRGSNKWAR